MEIPEDFTEERFSITFENNILYFTIHKELVDYSLVNDAINKRHELTKGEKVLILSDFQKVKQGTREARERLAAPDAGEGVIAVAVLIKSKVQKVMYNFFQSIYKAPNPSKLFTDRQKALEWLSKFNTTE
jgi:hypothetical protein